MAQEQVSENLKIRNYTPEDLEACRKLWVQLTEWHRQIYNSPGIGGADPGHYFDEHLDRVGPEHIWVAELAGQVVGMVGLILTPGEAELEPIAVSESYRDSGIGRRLAEAAINAARAQGVHQLKVRPAARNEAAIQFFHAMGFDILGQIELFMDLSPAEGQVWRQGERLAGRNFRV